MSQPHFRVVWELDGLHADGPVSAARQAFEIMQEQGTSATCFTVEDELGNRFSVDLIDEQPEADLIQ